MKRQIEIPDTVMSDAEIDEIAMEYSGTISERERKAEREKAAKPYTMSKHHLPNGEIDWDAVMGTKKRKPVEVSDEVFTDAEIDEIAG